MSFRNIQRIPRPDQLIYEIPLPKELYEIKRKRDREIISIFTGKSDKLLLIIGPCSADYEDAVCEYVTRLAKIQEKVKDKIVLVPRVYTNKPRTTGEGYKGMMHQPDPMDEPNIVEGIKALRRMHIKVIAESHLTAADEMLYPDNYPYVDDLLSYIAIGARSVENQQHRLAISGVDVPSGMKNPTSGDVNVMLNSVNAAQIPHVFIYNGWEVETSGNPYAHCILRGAVNHYGQNISNYHYEDLIRLHELYSKRHLANKAVIIDTNHSNSSKQYKDQPRIIDEVVVNMKYSKDMRGLVKGFMVESYLEEGSQKVGGDVFGKSITDPCLGWADSEKLILRLADAF
jgi:3-deoxy-7-phosphoheptulonate synthase